MVIRHLDSTPMRQILSFSVQNSKNTDRHMRMGLVIRELYAFDCEFIRYD